MAFAMFPISWLKPVPVPGKDLQRYPLAELHWRDHRAAGIAALLVLMTLAVRLNEENKKVVFVKGAERPKKVAVTWDDLQKITGCARATLGKAILLLENWNAISVTKVGRANQYELLHVREDGGWCKLPQTFLEKNGDPVARFKNLPTNALGLNALKLYVVLLALRSGRTETTAISFDGITRWTGIRREDIRKAWGFLDGQQLATVTHRRDFRHDVYGANDQSQRYAIVGLTPGYRQLDAELRASYEAEAIPGLPAEPAPRPNA
ncbi:MAG TPA: hypothetical protein VK198_13885 [Terriglobales bacterium]|nr:hypothetical protein [Terriglobales bacterium]